MEKVDLYKADRLAQACIDYEADHDGCCMGTDTEQLLLARALLQRRAENGLGRSFDVLKRHRKLLSTATAQNLVLAGAVLRARQRAVTAESRLSQLRAQRLSEQDEMASLQAGSLALQAQVSRLREALAACEEFYETDGLAAPDKKIARLERYEEAKENLAIYENFEEEG